MVEVGKLYFWKYFDEEGRSINVIVCPIRAIYVKEKFLGYFGYEIDRPEHEVYISSKSVQDMREVND